ncbi:unnamed protein product [Merluccius merluccius]
MLLSRNARDAGTVRWRCSAQCAGSTLEIRDFLERRAPLELMGGVFQYTLNIPIEFLSIVQRASDELEGSTIRPITWFFSGSTEIKVHCNLVFGDPAYMVHIPASASEMLDEKLIITQTHKIGTFLCPRCKSMNMLTIDECIPASQSS